MTAICTSTTTTTGSGTAQTLRGLLSTTSPATPQTGATDYASRAADVVDLSDRAKLLLQQAKDGERAVATILTSAGDILTNRTEALTEKLTEAFKALNVDLDFAVHLSVGRFGQISADGPWRAKIEKLFADDPDLAKELRTVTTMSSLKATQTALDLYYADKGAPGSQRHADAWTRYTIRAMNIQGLAGLITLNDGKLRSASVGYIDTIADPTGLLTNTSPRDVANRLA
jgi:hypothetical protein